MKLEDMTEPQLSELMQALANQIVAICAILRVEKPLFILLLFNDPAVAQYVSNCDRQDIVIAMRECADRLESNEDIVR